MRYLSSRPSLSPQAGWAGAQCEIPQCGPGCGLTGTCVRPSVCRCQAGYTGPSCQQPVCHPPCHHGGVCVKPFTCSCPRGRTGRFCQKSSSPSSSSSCPLNCQNGADCNHNLTACLCKPHYYGDFCQKRSDFSPSELFDSVFPSLYHC